MKRRYLERDLTLAERHVAEGAEKILRQRRTVERLAADGHNTDMARQILKTFEDLQATLVAQRDLVLRELAETATRTRSRPKAK